MTSQPDPHATQQAQAYSAAEIAYYRKHSGAGSITPRWIATLAQLEEQSAAHALNNEAKVKAADALAEAGRGYVLAVVARRGHPSTAAREKVNVRYKALEQALAAYRAAGIDGVE